MEYDGDSLTVEVGDWHDAKATREICEGADIEFLTTDEAKDRGPHELLDAELFVLLSAFGTWACVVKFNARRGPSPAEVFKAWSQSREFGPAPLHLVTYRLNKPAGDIENFSWMLASAGLWEPS